MNANWVIRLKNALVPATKRRLRRALDLEPLERRDAPATLTVNTTSDANFRDEVLSVREAIMVVNGTLSFADLMIGEKNQVNQADPLGTNDRIRFALGEGESTVTAQTQLPNVTNSVQITGSHPDYPTQSVVIRGANGNNFRGIVLAASNSDVYNLTVTGFKEEGILVKKLGSNAVWGCIIDGNRLTGNGYGVGIEDSSSNWIGLPGTAPSNVIAANTSNGIYIRGVTSTDNRVQNNDVFANLGNGILLANNSTGTRVGTYKTVNGPSGQGNWISDNKSNGISIADGAASNFVGGNVIGLERWGRQGIAKGNQLSGILVNTNGNFIGGDGEAYRNVVSANKSHGIELTGNGNEVVGNWVGLNAVGEDSWDDKGYPTGNAKNGINVTGDANAIGKANQARNVVSGNGENGIAVGSFDVAVKENDVVNNLLGASADGETAAANAKDAVIFIKQTDGTFVGNSGFYHKEQKRPYFLNRCTNLSPRRNTIEEAPDPAPPSDDSVPLIEESTDITLEENLLPRGAKIVNSSSIVLVGNFIGVDELGTDLENPFDGISIDSLSHAVTIGGGRTGEANVIRHNGGAAVRTAGTAVVVAANTVSDNDGGVVVEGGDATFTVLADDGLTVTAGTALFAGASSFDSVSLVGGALTLSPSASLGVEGDFAQTFASATVSAGATLDVGGSLGVSSGWLYLLGGTVQTGGGLSVAGMATLSGWGTVGGDLVNAGYVVVGGMSSLGTLHVTGDFTQTSTGNLWMEIESTAALDRLLIDGLATLDGNLAVSLTGNGSVSANDVFDLIEYGSRSGEFDSLWLPSSLTHEYDDLAGTFRLRGQGEPPPPPPPPPLP